MISIHCLQLYHQFHHHFTSSSVVFIICFFFLYSLPSSKDVLLLLLFHTFCTLISLSLTNFLAHKLLTFDYLRLPKPHTHIGGVSMYILFLFIKYFLPYVSSFLLLLLIYEIQHQSNRSVFAYIHNGKGNILFLVHYFILHCNIKFVNVPHVQCISYIRMYIYTHTCIQALNVHCTDCTLYFFCFVPAFVINYLRHSRSDCSVQTRKNVHCIHCIGW